jgi:hypothetical protein
MLELDLAEQESSVEQAQVKNVTNISLKGR